MSDYYERTRFSKFERMLVSNFHPHVLAFLHEFAIGSSVPPFVTREYVSL